MLKTKIMVFVSILCLFNGLALAENTDKSFYFKVITALNKNSDIKTVDEDINFALTQQANFSPTLGLSIGYYINSSSRIELVFENTNINFATKSGAFRFSENNITQFGIRTIKRKADVRSVMVNGYTNIIEKPAYKIFVGGGLGIGSSRIKERAFDKFDSNISVHGVVTTLPTLSASYVNKNSNTFSYALIVGTDFNICKGFNMEVAYSWKYSGRVKAEDNINNKYQGHNIGIAARFDL